MIKILKNKRGENYIDTVVGVVAAMMVIVVALNIADSVRLYVGLAGYKAGSDEDAGTDQTGRLWRSPLPHKRTTAKFTVKKMDLDKKIAFQSIVQGAITNAAERKMTVTYWNDDVNDYRTTECYVPDIEYSVRDADATTIYYNPISVELIEY